MSDTQHPIELLRFNTCGSVDDGKSTLIGRLLFDSKSIMEDQMEALERSSIDPYAVLRSAYTQARAKQIEQAGRPDDPATSSL